LCAGVWDQRIKEEFSSKWVAIDIIDYKESKINILLILESPENGVDIIFNKERF